jgi:hypothetical protein
MLKAAVLVVAALAGACSKNSPDAHASPKTAPAPAAAPAAAAPADDKTPPPGVDLGPLDDFERKVFFRVVNKESSACGKGESLLKSARATAPVASRSTA